MLRWLIGADRAPGHDQLAAGLGRIQQSPIQQRQLTAAAPQRVHRGSSR